MFCSQNPYCTPRASLLARHDLKAQLATLDRYGPGSLGAALVDGLRALMGASRNALCSESAREMSNAA